MFTLEMHKEIMRQCWVVLTAHPEGKVSITKISTGTVWPVITKAHSVF